VDCGVAGSPLERAEGQAQVDRKGDGKPGRSVGWHPPTLADELQHGMAPAVRIIKTADRRDAA